LVVRRVVQHIVAGAFLRSWQLSCMCLQVLAGAHCVLGALFAWLACMMCSSAPCIIGAW